MEFDQLSEQLQAALSENEILSESYSSMAAAMLELEDKGWNPFAAGSDEDKFSLLHLHNVAKHIREISEGNPLLKRGSGLRSSYIFGRGVSFTEQPPRINRLMMDTQNQDVLFSAEAQVINERSHFTDGQFFVLGNVTSKKFQRIPFAEITAVVTDPDDPEQIRYYRRTWNRNVQDLSSTTVSSKLMNVWYPTDTYEPAGGRYASSIQNQPVDVKYKMFASRVNRRAGNVWGIPDAFSAVPWAYAYNEYLKDGSKMLKALSMFAWQLKSKTKSGGTAAAATIATSSRVASTAVTGSDMELSSMPRANSVDLSNGRALGSMVASALEVSVVALLSDPGSSGAYGTAQTLDVPTIKAMEARQAVWTQFYFRIMKFMGARTDVLEINWPKIETEPSQRMMQALALAKEQGAIWDDEFRNAVIEVLDIAKLHDSVPSSMDTQSSGSAVPSQGNSGAVGSMQDNANDLRSSDDSPIA
jgi:hypothetical protein